MRAVEEHGARVGVAALSPVERQVVLDTLHEPRFVDLAPAKVHATLLDEGTYLCSERTMIAFWKPVPTPRVDLSGPDDAARPGPLIIICGGLSPPSESGSPDFEDRP